MSNIKKCFVSRFESGVLVNIDYKQLEVVALAVLSNCIKLKADLKAGVDKHSEYAIRVYGKVTPQLRTFIKRMTFQLQYGATAYGMAKSISIPEEVCKRFIEEYFAEYPEIADWHTTQLDLVESSRVPWKIDEVTGEPLGISVITSVTGRRYAYTQVAKAGRRGMYVVFPPTQIKNYPVQGIATGDLVPLMVSILVRWLFENNLDKDILVVNTVHDSIMLDCRNLFTASSYMSKIKAILEDAPRYMKEFYGFDWDMPTPVDVEFGTNWGELKTMTGFF